MYMHVLFKGTFNWVSSIKEYIIDIQFVIILKFSFRG